MQRPGCCICEEPFNDSKVLTVTSCSHLFDDACIREWLRKGQICPSCRAPCSLGELKTVFYTSVVSDHDTSDRTEIQNLKMQLNEAWMNAALAKSQYESLLGSLQGILATELSKQPPTAPPREEPQQGQTILQIPSTSSNISMNYRKLTLGNTEHWVASATGFIPMGAIKGGKDVTGQPLYVARAEYGGSLTPGKANYSGCYITWGCVERKLDSFEVLCKLEGDWYDSKPDRIPKNALKGGLSECGEILYVGRVKFRGKRIPGKVQPSRKFCYIPFEGKELAFERFEIFVVED